MNYVDNSHQYGGGWWDEWAERIWPRRRRRRQLPPPPFRPPLPPLPPPSPPLPLEPRSPPSPPFDEPPRSPPLRPPFDEPLRSPLRPFQGGKSMRRRKRQPLLRPPRRTRVRGGRSMGIPYAYPHAWTNQYHV